MGRAGKEAARCEPGRSEGGGAGPREKGRAVSEERVGWAQEKGEVR